MADISAQEMAAKLMSDGFGRTGPVADALTDPVADTPMVVTLDDLRPYELDPRITRNPLYDEIKASIRERGLDAPPPITRRPGATHYIIRNGGNTRLAILRELWTETRDERFFRIACLFRPWPEKRGEIVALTGHLAENELHGGLSFIERALGVENVRALYEQEDGKPQPLSQSELARRLKADGYPVPQPHISRMQEAIQYLLPAIPNVLYGGLGRHQVEQLTGLRRAGTRVWEARAAAKHGNIDFATLFQDVLSAFDGAPGAFNIQRVQDELIGQMADLLNVNYDTLALEITDSEKRWQLLNSEPVVAPPADLPASSLPAPQTIPPSPASKPLARPSQEMPAPEPDSGAQTTPAQASPEPLDDQPNEDSPRGTLLEEHIVSPAPTTDRLKSIQRLIAEQTGETGYDFESNVLHSIPVQAGGLYPISDVWYIDPSLDEPEHLRTHIAQFALEIASEAGIGGHITACDDGIGFSCTGDIGQADAGAAGAFPRAVLSLLQALSAPYQSASRPPVRIDTSYLSGDLGTLLLGLPERLAPPQGQGERHTLSDNTLVKLYRLLRLARRLLVVEATITITGGADSAMPGS
ncbi:ParB family protein [Pectobacterium actinidiae]|uniref:ParB family protein n=1 Tax=Pectobacterium actinidiae TaxID=1507808 RepID=UPI00404080F4